MGGQTLAVAITRACQQFYVIALGDDGPCKLGYATNPTQRLCNLQIGNHLELKLYSRWIATGMTAEKLEWIVHKAFRATWLRGEWFDTTPAEVHAFLCNLDAVQPFDTSDYSIKALERAAACHPRAAIRVVKQ